MQKRWLNKVKDPHIKYPKSEAMILHVQFFN